MTLQQVFGRRSAAPVLGAAMAAAFALGGCSMFKDKAPPPPCPTIKIDRDTAKVTQFRGGSDITDIVMETEILGYTGECKVDKKTNTVDMALSVIFQANLGPAAGPGDKDGERRRSFAYFVALPDFFPHPAGKQTFSAEVPFPPNVNQVRYRDAEVTLHIPLGKSMSSGDARVYIGMQLTDEQLQYNRKNQPQY
ncbi:hypothetical protein [Oleispirillum naphthae]|uniref:hypothetical protein n=1 Tax=Oleispirillum naphthae TaxID=2838853 RepID=UPI0030826071